MPDQPLPVDADAVGETEELDALPVLASATELEQPGSELFYALAGRSPVSVQAAAVAATGFVAGAATVAVLRRRRTRRALRESRRRRLQRGVELAPVVATRSFLVDVHLLGSRD